MDFFHQHFNRHHLLHAPHLWFLALLSSPIHYAELHYQKYYHLRFQHARKLFIFDLTLLGSIIGISLFALAWFFFDPTVIDQINLSIKPSNNRLASGDHVTYTISYHNNSNTVLENPVLHLSLPSGMIVDNAVPTQSFDPNTFRFTLPSLAPQRGGEASVSGWLFGTPHQEEHISVWLTYNQEDRLFSETKLVTILQYQRDSKLKMELNPLPASLLSSGSIPLIITLQNTSEQTLHHIRLPLEPGPHLTLSTTKTTIGDINQKVWEIPTIAPAQEVRWEGQLLTSIPDSFSEIFFTLTPTLRINGQDMPQNTWSKQMSVLHPQLAIDNHWSGDITSANPNETITLELTIRNSGNINLKNLQVIIPIPPGNLINTDRFVSLNSGTYKNQTLIIDSQYRAQLLQLKAGETLPLSLSIPITTHPGQQENPTLNLQPQIRAQVSDLPDTNFNLNSETPELKISSYLDVTSALRYFTVDGDQLGRGPLPPQVDKTTKYWAIISLKNGPNKISDLVFFAHLPENVLWTGKSSVSLGQDIKYDNNQHSISWQHSSLPAWEEIGIYFELALTPTSEQLGTTPIVLSSPNFQATDTFTNRQITKNLPNLDTSLPLDLIGQEKGGKVE
ncbi:MAG TPA: hypothetical protein VJB37_01555 [Patescibacteria group bacterium]|nr:hypothetical protein [Patescibacteria group bacterium]